MTTENCRETSDEAGPGPIAAVSSTTTQRASSRGIVRRLLFTATCIEALGRGFGQPGT